MSDHITAGSLLAAIARRRGASGAGLIGRRLEFHGTLGSTNDRARDLAASGEPEGTVVVADEQTRGRGRSGRSWHSAPGLGLYLSVILRPDAPPASAPLFGLLASVAAAAALSRHSPAAVRIRWPNDLIADSAPPEARRKLAGILPESRTGSDRIRDLVVGIGVNVNHRTADFPGDIAARATSLRILAGVPLERAEVAATILTELDDWYTLWARDGGGPVLAAFRSLAYDLQGRRVRVTGGPSLWEGTTAGLSDEGALRVVPAGGTTPVEVRWGEVLRLEEA